MSDTVEYHPFNAQQQGHLAAILANPGVGCCNLRTGREPASLRLTQNGGSSGPVASAPQDQGGPAPA